MNFFSKFNNDLSFCTIFSMIISYKEISYIVLTTNMEDKSYEKDIYYQGISDFKYFTFIKGHINGYQPY